MYRVSEKAESTYDVPVDPDPVPDPVPDGTVAVSTFDHERLDAYRASEKAESTYSVPVDPDPDPDPVPDGAVAVGTFDHERLDAYKVSIEFVGEASRLISQLPTGHSSLAQQLYRASISIPLNIAEGSGEFSRKDKARFYRIALRSATECAAILDVCRELELAKPQLTQGGRSLLLRIVAMLTSMAKKYSGSGSGTGSGSN